MIQKPGYERKMAKLRARLSHTDDIRKRSEILAEMEKLNAEVTTCQYTK